MKEIELKPVMEYDHKLELDVIDFVDGDRTRPRKRCGITVDYSWRDIKELEDMGMDPEAMMEHYRNLIYDLVKVNIAQDWECVGGMDETLEIVRRHTCAKG